MKLRFVLMTAVMSCLFITVPWTIQAVNLPIINTVAGNGTNSNSGDGGPATAAALGSPRAVTVDNAGNIYIATPSGIRKVSAATGIITTVNQGFSNGVALDSDGNVYSTITGPYGWISKVSAATGNITTVAQIFDPMGVAVDSGGNIYIADNSPSCIRKVTAAGIITTVAGNGSQGYSGDGGPATAAQLYRPYDVALDSAGNMYIADTVNQRIRKVTAAGIITTVAGNGTSGSSGDGGPATAAGLNDPTGVAVDSAGNIYIATGYNIRKVTNTTGIITTVAGNGTSGYSGDGGLATAAALSMSWSVAVDSAGNIYIADYYNYRIREVSVEQCNVPGIPTGVSAISGYLQATVSFTAPASNGGAIITSYTVTSNPGGKTATGSASPITVMGLTNGIAYTFTVTASNAAGTGSASSPSNSVTPYTLPGVPTSISATAGLAQATVSFTAPTSDGGSSITSYTVTSNPGNIAATGTSSPITVKGLTGGTAYTFTATATNASGTGSASSPSNSVTPTYTVPSAPTGVSASPGSGQATVSFTAPASNGKPITSYTVISNPGNFIATGAASPITVKGLINGTAYTFTVTATNAAGNSPASAPSNSATPLQGYDTVVPALSTWGLLTAAGGLILLMLMVGQFKESAHETEKIVR